MVNLNTYLKERERERERKRERVTYVFECWAQLLVSIIIFIWGIKFAPKRQLIKWNDLLMLLQNHFRCLPLIATDKFCFCSKLSSLVGLLPTFIEVLYKVTTWQRCRKKGFGEVVKRSFY